ncbi:MULTISPECIES: YkvI family membrane protein [Staphylococcus]|uniref:YkvI family membrane protein n=1 Tax=Staphylococcus sp. HMSC34C02 TaxID=1608858 RepID=UPI0035249BE7
MVAFAFVGVVVGAGFATGQEIFQFFTSHGSYSIAGIIVTGLIITLAGVFVLNTGFTIQSHNHSESIQYYLHPMIARIFDIILTLFLFSLAMIMTAGGASTIHESFGLPYWLSSLLLVLFILMTLFLKFERLITVLGMVTPFLVIVVSIIAIYYFITGDVNFSAANRFNKQHGLSLGWWFDGLNYASLQIAAAFSFLSVMGGRMQHRQSALWGGILGGIIITLLLLMINLGLVTEFEHIHSVALPTLLLANHISPLLGTMMSIIMILVIYNTIVGLMYAFASRFTEPFTKGYFVLIIAMAIVTFICTFIGFISLIGKVFPIMGLFGFILLIPILYQGFKHVVLSK